MVIVYLDIETYSEGEEVVIEPSIRIILIHLKEIFDNENIKTLIFKEWESSEKDILKQFYEHFHLLHENERTVWCIGFNIFRFDIPLLIYRLAHYEIDSLPNLFEIFRKAYIVDLRQCLLPFSDFKFKELSAEKVAEKLGIRKPKYSNKEIREFYKKEETEIRERIVEHSESDLSFIQDLYWVMKKEPEKLMRLKQ
jgi:DNA polymerase elongation subunit (family B)